MKIAVPLIANVLSEHFGQCEQFGIYTIEDNQIKESKLLKPPPHQPGVLPRWLQEQGVDVIIASGMGMKAQSMFDEKGITVVCGAASIDSEEIVARYLNGTLETSENICDRH